MKNPSKYLRLAYITTLQNAGITVPIWEDRVPITVNPIPSTYILLEAQINNRRAIGKDCWEWNCTITVDAIHTMSVGRSSNVVVDDLEEQIINAVESGLVITGGFKVKSYELLTSIPSDFDTATHSVNRRLITYQHWLNRAI